MRGFSATDSFYQHFVEKLQHSWTVVAPVVAADGVCRLQELGEAAGRTCPGLPLIPLKKILLPPSELLWSSQEGRYRLPPTSLSPAGVALINVAPCDLYALDYLDQAFAEDPFYQARSRALIIDLLTLTGTEPGTVPVPTRAGSGTVVIEAPRGVLIHHYVVDDRGQITAADIVTPTAINQRAIEAQLLTDLQETPEGELDAAAQRIVRAFDPCISCAVHILKV